MKRPVIGAYYVKPVFYTPDPDMEQVQKGLLTPPLDPLRPSRINWWLIAAAAALITSIILSTSPTRPSFFPFLLPPPSLSLW